ncbi:MAG TPA: hypothetical protein PLQ13_07585 [Candidatus Krumholzibacteria bacterium]|nr:hypothetical protein [Candidatus Krumholzibacteria bacterium]
MSCTRLAGAALVAALSVGAAWAAAGPAAVDPVIIPLAGPAATREAEISSLAWAGDTLVLLPEVPGRFARGDTLAVFALDGAAVRAWLDVGDRSAVLTPRRVPCFAPGLADSVRGFDGLEALAVAGARWYVAVEAKADSGMAGWLLAGTYDLQAGAARLDVERRVPIPLGVNIFNVSDETLVVDGDRVLALGEANGVNVQRGPVARAFTLDLEPAGALPLPNLEYRITDATAVDAARRFWVIDYFYPPERRLMPPGPDAERTRFGVPDGLDTGGCIERLLELAITADDAIVRTDTPPLWLVPQADGVCRNWEGLVRLDDRGFLLVTDKHPATLLAFVPRQGR